MYRWTRQALRPWRNKRIAGMGYAEAADAMTVAIRGFKMEMSDASHVTDVYSEVAAMHVMVA